MGIETEISWCHHTHNGVRGCSKKVLADGSIDPSCVNCYAESMSKRNPRLLGQWGEEGKRVLAGDEYWRQLDKWHDAAVKAGEMRRVFCYSLGDVFEAPRSLSNVDVCAKGRKKLFDAIERLSPKCGTIVRDKPLNWSGLVFMLLTKRPENIRRMVPKRWLEPGQWPWWAWVGTSVGNQRAANEHIPYVLDVPAKVRFLSCEPLVEEVDLSQYMPTNRDGYCTRCGCHWSYVDGGSKPVDGRTHVCPPGFEAQNISLVITGGESGHHARPCHPEWVRKLMRQTKRAGAAFHHKQNGEWMPDEGRSPRMTVQIGGVEFERIGKKAAGRLLDGREWAEMPEACP